ncbi:Uncharacterised protein [uncultured Ruminococcus sp.]|uniref:Winged helix-turn-helix transcriptional regulator n=1 Tax=Massiliimalia timonensis TaxID=1987501 RepID=A0A8J6PF48_9FIRM|nr:MarR family winged helix-turn-helix transcriptional regulator [Massiliimalia timonensis]MBC8611131.1 winged helix-turn-helix transcriptional regulator [Massiliimalia timonensis]MBS7175304.1 winged helix-turn-helix transcriptional regulator [Clostridiales bacterium]SCI15865.1 Uncharacterised protein [uncultured Clostridium sp.]SCI39343.1 Uncharacterised protein [uncultured Ruminococcus sp.]
MPEKAEDMVREFNRIDKELNDLYHDIALKIGISDSAFTVFYIICERGDGCLQRDICYEAFANKQTINSSIRKLEREGYLYLQQGRGRDKHIYLTELGKEFARRHILPVIQMENDAFCDLELEERQQCLRIFKKYVAGFKAKAQNFLA